MGIPRTLEPEVMDTVEEAEGYDSMDHSEVNRVFVDDLLKAAASHQLSDPCRVLDLGTGTALIPIELCNRGEQWKVCAVDLAEEMLKVGQRNVDAAGFGDRIELLLADAKSLSESRGPFDAVMSNSIVHHIPEPLSVIRVMKELLKPGGLLLIRDLLRPDSDSEVERLVDLYADGATDHQRQMFRESLHAALTIDEVGAMLDEVGFPRTWLRQTTDRHWTINSAWADDSALHE